MKNFFSFQAISDFTLKYTKYILFLTLVFVVALLSFSIINHFKTQKKSLISAEIAIGLANSKEGKNEKALYFLQKAFNESEGLYRVISGIGILGVVQNDKVKILSLLNILKNEKNENFLLPLIESVYFSNLAAFGEKQFLLTEDFRKFKLSIIKIGNNILKEQLVNIFLLINDENTFNSIINSVSENENNQSGFTVQNRIDLLKSLQ